MKLICKLTGVSVIATDSAAERLMANGYEPVAPKKAPEAKKKPRKRKKAEGKE